MPNDTAALLRKKEDWANSLAEPERGRWLDFYGRFYGTDEGRGHLAWAALRAHHAAAADANAVPNPGSPQALGHGCRCPQIDNHYGEGRPSSSGRSFIILRGCPVHSPVFGEDPDEVEAMMDCGRTDDGTCMLAGTEHCDFECPYRDALP